MDRAAGRRRHELHRLTNEGEYFGQSGGGTVVDFNGDGVNELVFSSWDQNTVAVWSRTGATMDTKLSVTPAKGSVKAGKKATWAVKLAAPRTARSAPSR